MSLLKRVARAMPPGVVRWIGALQFKVPLLGGLIRRTASWAATGEGIIQEGIGKGLRFDATGGYFGYLAGTSEPEEQALVAKHLKEGMVFYDIGANIGFYAVLGARLVGAKGHIYAFEPFAQSAQAVHRNVQLNNFDNVTIVEAAVSDKNGVVRFASDELSAKNKIVGSNESSNTTEVQSITLDVWAAQTNARLPDVIMIDIEGAEIGALQGMHDLLSRSRPVLLCEVHWLGEKMIDYCESVLKPLGYTVSTYAGAPLPHDTVRYHLYAVPNQ